MIRSGRRIVPSAQSIVAALALPLALYVVLRPENYGLTPNALDPIFYTGYAINLDDMMHAVGGHHYFVSRWSAYLPGYVADAFAGPVIGRLLWRLLLAALILQVIWSFGRRWNRTVAQRFLVGTLVLTMPIFVRAFFTDYVEYLVVALGVCLVGMCLRPRQTVWSAALIGVMSGLIVVANPVAVTLVGLCVLTSLIVGARSWRHRAIVAVIAGAAALAVVLAGLVLFRWWYGIDNVYQPSIDFIRSYHVTNDPWRSPQHRWLAEFTWLYGVPIVLVGAAILAFRRTVTFDRIEKAALILCAVEYSTHWFDQFVRHGLSLEVSFYWSFSYPTFAVALAVVVGRLTDGLRARVVIGIGVAWIAFLLIGVPDALRLPSGALFALVSVAVIGASVAIARRAPWVPVVLIVGLVGWTQIGAPDYVPTADTQINASPKYDELFRHGGDESETILHEAVWFEEQMDRVHDDARSAFLPVGGWASPIVALYAPHITGRIVYLDANQSNLATQSIADIKGGARPILVVYGPVPAVDRIVATFPQDLGLGTQLLDETHQADLRYRLVVFAMPDASVLPFTWRADALPLTNGHLVGTTAVVSPGDQPGIVTFGPYIRLRPGRYAATVHYSSTEPVGKPVGVFDVSSPGAEGANSAVMTGTDGLPGQITIVFDVVDPTVRYEFRSRWDGIGSMTVDSVTYDHS
jgi:hypothetical protein